MLGETVQTRTLRSELISAVDSACIDKPNTTYTMHVRSYDQCRSKIYAVNVSTVAGVRSIYNSTIAYSSILTPLCNTVCPYTAQMLSLLTVVFVIMFAYIYIRYRCYWKIFQHAVGIE